jgi:hypothetical protein
VCEREREIVCVLDRPEEHGCAVSSLQCAPVSCTITPHHIFADSVENHITVSLSAILCFLSLDLYILLLNHLYVAIS